MVFPLQPELHQHKHHLLPWCLNRIPSKGIVVYEEWWTSQCDVHVEKDDQQISRHRRQNHLRKEASRAAIKKKNVPILSCEKSLNQ